MFPVYSVTHLAVLYRSHLNNEGWRYIGLVLALLVESYEFVFIVQSAPRYGASDSSPRNFSRDAHDGSQSHR